MLITPKEEARLAEIATVAVEGKVVKRPDIIWLCELTQRLARMKPTEEDFAPYAALINQVACTAIPLGFIETIPLEQQTCVIGPFNAGPGHLWQIFDHTTEFAVCDAALCVRPYIRLVEPKTDAMLDRLARLGRVGVTFNNHKAIDEGPAEEHLVGFDGYGLRRKPFRFQGYQSLPPKSDVFGVGTLDPEKGDSVPLEHGVFMPNDTKVKIVLSGVDLEEGERLRVSTGLVMGRYSTKMPGLPPGFVTSKSVRHA